jgi:two-component system chemotaxis response regulator CheB
VVIGASAGGVEALRTVVAGLPSDLAAEVCIVLHLAPGSPSALAGILDRVAPLRCRPAADGDPLRYGEIVVAPRDRHLVICDGHVDVTVGPRENGHRPSVDVLFRSAAEAKQSRVVGVVLSGTRDDGTAGLAVIKTHGGCAIVQDPEDALYAGMPASALAHVHVDAVARSDEIARVIVRMVSEESWVGGQAGANPGPGPMPGERVTSVFQECGGVLSERHDAAMTQWRCRVGHRYSPESFADAQAEGVEPTLWAAVRARQDRHALLERMASQLEQRDLRRSARALAASDRPVCGNRAPERPSCRAREAEEQAEAVKVMLGRAAQTTLRRIGNGSGVDPAGEEEVLHGSQ